MSKFTKKKITEASGSVELNIMPFIDIFSLLCTFLLFSAVFVSIGIHTVQVPFLSNAASTEESEKTRDLVVNVSIDSKDIELKTYWTEKPTNEKVDKFDNTDQGIELFHQALLSLKYKNQKSEKVTLYVHDEMKYNKLIKMLDILKIPPKSGLNSLEQGEDSIKILFPKVVIGSVIK